MSDIDTARFLLGDLSPACHRLDRQRPVWPRRRRRRRRRRQRRHRADRLVERGALVGRVRLTAAPTRRVEADAEILGTDGSDRIWTMPLPPPADYVHCDVPMYAAQLADVEIT